ncbi:MAG: molecular chaperone HtpG [Planctomycetota bacterium]|jgi:molecular chaperone HtpG
MTETTNEYKFQAEVSQVLGIVINSLYSHREVFLRELLSNAADAIDKLRFESLTDHNLIGDDTELEIKIRVDKDEKTLIISDNGLGMSKEDLIENLGTIAHSGSQKFLKALEKAGKSTDSVDLIGQFGVGFYSAFLVSDRVEVTSRAANTDEVWRWTSTAETSFTVESVEDESLRGTEVKLFIGDDHAEYLEETRIRHLVQRYSDYVSHPIKLRTTQEAGEDAVEVVWDTINKAGALWKRPKSEIEDEQYDEFYRHLTNDWESPLARTHFTIEGSQLFTGLLFVPSNPPFDMFDRDQSHGVRLYVKRVFIMDDCESLLPTWLRFVRGIVDSDDLPLNVSREVLQDDKLVRSIKKGVTKKILDLIEGVAKDDAESYQKFWTNYGTVLKEGIHFDSDFRARLAPLCRFASTKSEYTSLDEYIERMPEDQSEIYYVIGPSKNAVEGSPHIEVLKKRDYEVLYMVDPVDEWAVESLGSYQEKKLTSAMRADLDLNKEETEDDKKEREIRDEGMKPLVEKMEANLTDLISEVRVSDRLTDSPVCLVVPEGGVHAHIERLLRQQNKDMPTAKRILEINPDHAVIKKLSRMVDVESEDSPIAEWIFLLYDQACLAEGSPIADPPSFAKRMSKLMGQALG